MSETLRPAVPWSLVVTIRLLHPMPSVSPAVPISVRFTSSCRWQGRRGRRWWYRSGGAREFEVILPFLSQAGLDRILAESVPGGGVDEVTG